MTTLEELVAEKGWVIADGATGTNYFKLGLETGYPPELWNIERPDDVAGLHSAFIESGIVPKYPEWEANGVVDREVWRKQV